MNKTALKLIRASAPGTLMVLGEHAVLQGEPCIACAVDQRLEVELSALTEPRLVIDSALAYYDAPLHALVEQPALSFVLAAVQARLAELLKVADQQGTGLHIRVQSEFSHVIGLGSSAAVCVAMVAALDYWLAPPECKENDENISLSPDRRQAIFQQARGVMLAVQGRGSGFDIAAATYGALIAYQLQPLSIRPLAVVPAIGLFYAGYKTPTPVVLEQVAQAAAQQPEYYQSIYQAMGACTRQAIDHAEAQDWPAFGRLMNEYQTLMVKLGVSDPTLEHMLTRLQAQPVMGAKISGSGLGDCVISLGDPQGLDIGYQRIPVAISPRGVEVSVTGMAD